MSEEKRCDCHDYPMRWDRDARYTAGGFWRCRVKHNESQRRLYDNQSGVRYNRMLLMSRRRHARQRQRRRTDSPGGE